MSNKESSHPMFEKAQFAMKNLDLLVARSPSKTKVLSLLEDDCLEKRLQLLRRKPYFEGLPPPDKKLSYNHLTQELKYAIPRDTFKRLTDEEIAKYKEFSKNYVFIGDQFLYENVKNPQFKYDEFARRMKMSELKIRDIKKKAGRISRNAIEAKIEAKVQKLNVKKIDENDELNKLRSKIEQIKDLIEEYVYKRDKIAAENDHNLKANTLLQESSRQIHEDILSLEIGLMEASEHKINISKERPNQFEESDEILLWRKMENFEKLLETCIEVGKRIDNFAKTNLRFVAKSFPLSYIHQQITNAELGGLYSVHEMPIEDTQFKAYEPMLEENKKKQEVTDEIFKEMKEDRKIPKYLKNNLSHLKKLESIRNYYQSC